MDVIALSRAGLENAVAPLGTALTEEQIHELWRVVGEPVLCFDGDAAGNRAAERAAERVLPLLRPAHGMRFAVLPAGEDPDSMIAGDGAETFTRLLAEAIPLSAFLWRSAIRARPPNTPEERVELWQTLREHASKIADPGIRREFRETFYESLWPDRRKAGSGGKRRLMTLAPVDGKSLPSGLVDPFRDAEKTALAIIVSHPEFFQEIEDEIGSLGFADSALDQLRQELISLLSGGSKFDVADLKEELRGRGLADALDMLLEDPVIKIHRVIGQGASGEQVRLKWDEAMRVLQAAALDVELDAASGIEDYSDEAMDHRLKLKRASLNDLGD
jgi:DNA primase